MALGKIADLASRHQIQVALQGQLAKFRLCENGPMKALGQPVQQGNLCVDLDRKPAVRGRQTNAASCDAQTLSQHRRLTFRTPDVLPDGRTMNKAERTIAERQIQRVGEK